MLIIDSAEVILRHYAKNFKHPRMRNLQSLNNTSSFYDYGIMSMVL